jgi:PQQ-dependent catabolism-associated CXXCW motif protein
MSRRRCAFAALAILALSGLARAGDAPPEPEHYRTENYRAPTPATLRGARVATTDEAALLWRERAALFVDVLPHPPRPAGLPEGTLWRERPHASIPGSIWLPDTGYGALAEVTENYLRTALETATGGDRGRALVIFCQRNCWMSWNAAKRVVALGYQSVVWYPDGTDGWQAAGLPLAETQPVPRPAE